LESLRWQWISLKKARRILMSLSAMSLRYVYAIYAEESVSYLVSLCVFARSNRISVFANATELGSSTMDMGRNEGCQCHAVPIQG